MKTLPAFLILIIFSEFSNAQKNKQQDVDAIKAARAFSNKCIAEHNVAGLTKYIREDFVQVRRNGSHLTGRDTIMKSWEKLFQSNPKINYIRNTSEIIISDNDSLAWETGKWTAINSYSKGGNYSAMWRKSENEWKLQAELFVSLKD